jgi:RNA polymerase sigma-70 factor (ECF subfamily)
MSSGAQDELDGRDMRRLVAGQDAALDELMTRHGERLFRFLIRELGDETEAADLAQETFVRVYQNSGRFDPDRKFSTWLFAIAANLVRDKFRWRTRHPQVSIDATDESTGLDGLGLLPDVRPTPGEHLERSERAEAVSRAVGELPPDLRTPLLLAEYEGLGHNEIGEVLGCSAKAVEMRIYRARQQLRLKLAGLLSEA